VIPVLMSPLDVAASPGAGVASLRTMTEQMQPPPPAADTTATDAALFSSNGGFIELLGLRFDEVGPDRVVLSWDVTPAQHQPFGIVHGGVHASVVETAASVGAGLWLGARGQVVGVSNHTDFLRAVRSGTLRAVGEPIHRGRLQQLWLVEIRDDGERLVARGQVRLQNVTDAHRLGTSAGTDAGAAKG
jgi:1,4-dihydroxy-2-naphthoyl-CoA hydrolase